MEFEVLWSKARKRFAGKPIVKLARSCGFLKTIKYLFDNRLLCQTLLNVSHGWYPELSHNLGCIKDNGTEASKG